MAAKPKSVNFQGKPLTLNRMDSRSFLIQQEISPSSIESVPLSPTYSFGKDLSYSDYYLTMDTERSWRNDSISSDAPLLLQNGSLSPTVKIPICRPGHAASRTQSNHIYGVGDLEHVQIEGMNRNNPRMYDYADYGHQYEELPGGRKSTVKYPVDAELDSSSQYQSSGGTTVISETADTADIVQGSSDKRKRVNPLYDAMMVSTPSLYNKRKGPQDKILRRQVRYLKCALVVLFVFCLASLAVSIFTMISFKMEIKDMQGDIEASDLEHEVGHSALADQLNKLTSDYADLQQLIAEVQGSNTTLEMMTNLIHKVSQVERNSSAQIGVLHRQIEGLRTNISQNSDKTDIVYTNLKLDLFNLSTSVQQQLDTISKMEGPRGPQGVVNFSLCSYSNKTNNSPASKLHPSYTGWLPDDDDVQAKFVIWAACSSDNGTGYMIETHAIDSSTVQFRCVCSGVVDDRNTRRFCHLHVITCPRNS